MRLCIVLVTAILTAPAAWAQSTSEDPAQDSALNLPVSLDKIRGGLEATPIISLRTIDERPMFRVMVRERMKIDELIASLNFKSTSPAPGGGLYGFEMQRQMFPAVDNPLRQPYAAFSQPELLTILIENLARKYLVDKAASAITNAERAHAQAAAKEEVRQAVAEYCAAQPSAGAGILICDAPIR
jgi:hypothetical protein